MNGGRRSLPKGWATARLGEVIPKARPKVPADPTSELPFIGMDHIEANSFHLIGQDEFSKMKSAGSYFQSGDVLYGRLRPYLNKLHRAKFKGVASAEFIVLPASEFFESDFIKFVLHQRKFVDFAMSQSSGDRPRVKFNGIADFEFQLPPLNEQRRIVEKIELLFARLDKGEEALRAVQTLLARYRQSVLKAAVTGELTADWRAENADRLEHGRDLLARILQTRRESWEGRGRYKEPVGPDTSNLPKLPKGWVWATVDQLLRGGLSNGRSVPDAPEGFPVLRLTALKDGLIDVSERKIGAWDADGAAPFLIARGDILVSRGNGSKQLVGRGGLVADEVDPVAYPDTMIRIPILLDYLSLSWFLQLWNSPFMRSQIENAAKTTAGIYKINQTDIRNFNVPLPPLAEQEEVSATVDEQLSKIGVLQKWCETELARSAALRQSILKDAFAGRLVSQDPADEPAANLLARIPESRASAPKKTRRKVTA